MRMKEQQKRKLLDLIRYYATLSEMVVGQENIKKRVELSKERSAAYQGILTFLDAL